MKFEEALSLMREGKKVKLYNRVYRIDDLDLVYFNDDCDCWDIVIMSGWDILSEDWEVVDD